VRSATAGTRGAISQGVAARPTVLVVEDEPSILQPLLRALDREGFEARSACSVAEALAVLDRGGIDLVVLDLGLPDGDGRDVCRRVRADGDLPVIILTARGSELDRVVGLELGADDYVVKPFSSAELAARIRAVLRRAARPAAGARPSPVAVGAVHVDPATRRATAGGAELELTRREFDLLLALARREGAVAPRDQLVEEVWGGPWYGSPKVLDVQIAGLRRKLGPRFGRALETVRGIGYRLAPEDG